MPQVFQSDVVRAFAGFLPCDAVKAAREFKGYSLEKMSLACGLATGELADLESGRDADPAKLRRIANALQLPETALFGS